MKNLVVAGVMASISAVSQADLISTDWQSQGDRLSTYDTHTQLEWLDVTATNNMTVSQALSETGSGGQFEGWRLASYQEVDALFRHHFNWDGWDGQLNSPYAQLTYDVHADSGGQMHNSGVRHYTESLGNFLGYVSGGYSYAKFLDIDNEVTYSGVSRTGDIYHFNGNYADTWNSGGVFLVSDGGVTLSSIQDPTLGGLRQEAAPVPLPATAFLLTLGGLAFVRQRHNDKKDS